MKKILFALFIFVIVFLIYSFNINKKVYYLSLGDYLSYGINNNKIVNNTYSNNLREYYKDNLENYVNYSVLDDYRVMDLYNDITSNKKIKFENKEYNIQNLLIKANLITISIGMNDLLYKIEYSNNIYDYTDELLNDIEKLLVLIRKYNKDKIYVLGFYNIIDDLELINYANLKLNKICNQNKVVYVDISNLDKYILKDRYPTNDGYTYISNQILNFTK